MANRRQRQNHQDERASKEAYIQALFRAGESGKKSRKKEQSLRRQENQAARKTFKQKQRLRRKAFYQHIPRAILEQPESLPFFDLV